MEFFFIHSDGHIYVNFLTAMKVMKRKETKPIKEI